MEHFNQNFTGWFTYFNYYKELAKKLPNNCTFAEIGCWTGKAVSFMMVELINQNKNPTIICVDTWEGFPEHIDHPEIINKSLIHDFYENTKPIRKNIIPMCGKSINMAKLIADNSLDGIFIDADHGYEESKSDILSWLPKVKNGGIICGHDYDWNPGGVLTVKRATDDIFGENSVTVYRDEHGSCWEIIKK